MLEDVAKQHSSTMGQLARLAAADLYFAEGCYQMFLNKVVAQQELQKALEHYREVEQAASLPEIRARARFGLARTYEALAGTRAGQGSLRLAITTYQEVIRDFPNTPYAEFAQQRLSQLETDEFKAFYDRFAQYDPRPELRPESAPTGMPGTLESSLPAEPPVVAPSGEAGARAERPGVSEETQSAGSPPAGAPPAQAGSGGQSSPPKETGGPSAESSQPVNNPGDSGQPSTSGEGANREG
jgi:tetratricopeptide (TPR) repeat protein